MVLTIDGLDAEIVYPTLAGLLGRLRDTIRKGHANPDDWATRATTIIDALPAQELGHLAGDLMHLREQYPAESEQRRLVTGLGWTPALQRATHDDAVTCVDVIEHLVYARLLREKR
jgi:hypothetical protein